MGNEEGGQHPSKLKCRGGSNWSSSSVSYRYYPQWQSLRTQQHKLSQSCGEENKKPNGRVSHRDEKPVGTPIKGFDGENPKLIWFRVLDENNNADAVQSPMKANELKSLMIQKIPTEGDIPLSWLPRRSKQSLTCTSGKETNWYKEGK